MGTKIRNCDKGTAYADALTAGRRLGPEKATNDQLMAMFCEDIMQAMVGAFSPRLVWDGARKAGLTALELHNICAARDFDTLDRLQFDV